MIRAIVAVDSKRGVADNNGIPWDLPTDRQHFRDLTKNGIVLMGHNTYQTLKKPLQHRRNLVWCKPDTVLRDGFRAINNLAEYLETTHEDTWVMGGGALYKASLQYCKELYITQIQADCDCTKFFPEFSDNFNLKNKSTTHSENGQFFNYQTWVRF